MDHHVLARQDLFLAPYVTEIIDHRPKDKSAWNFKEDTRTTIEIVGSCCTLVAERIKHLCTVLGKDVEFFQTHPICIELLHSKLPFWLLLYKNVKYSFIIHILVTPPIKGWLEVLWE